MKISHTDQAHEAGPVLWGPLALLAGLGLVLGLWTPATFFDLGVYLIVLGTLMTIFVEMAQEEGRLWNCPWRRPSPCCTRAAPT